MYDLAVYTTERPKRRRRTLRRVEVADDARRLLASREGRERESPLPDRSDGGGSRDKVERDTLSAAEETVDDGGRVGTSEGVVRGRVGGGDELAGRSDKGREGDVEVEVRPVEDGVVRVHRCGHTLIYDLVPL